MESGNLLSLDQKMKYLPSDYVKNDVVNQNTVGDSMDNSKENILNVERSGDELL